MKSTIKIDCDHEGKPVIKMFVSQDCSDLRDKMLRIFIEELGYESNHLRIDNNPSEGMAGVEYQIRPVREILISQLWKATEEKAVERVSDVRLYTQEGRLLMAALTKLTTESQTDKTPDQVLKQCDILQKQMYEYKNP